MQALVLPTVGEDAIGSDHNGYGGWDKGQKYRAQRTPRKRDFAKRLSARSPDAPTYRFEYTTACKTDIGHDPVGNNGEYCKERGTWNTYSFANDTLGDKFC